MVTLPGMSGYSDPDEALARVQRDIEAAQRRAVAAGEVRGRIDAIRGRASTPSGDVSLEVDVTGRLTALDLDENALDRGARELSRLVVELVARAGAVDTILCHTDFDGIASAAKWMLGGVEPYPGCDDDARAIDTRIGVPSERALRLDRALRARPTDERLLRSVFAHLARTASSDDEAAIDRAVEELLPIERETNRAAQKFRVYSRRRGGTVAYVDVSEGYGRLDKTSLLLEGQKKASLSIVVDLQNVAMAAPFDSGIDFLKLLDLEGGMPTRVSVSRSRLDDVLARLEVDFV